MTKSTTKTVKVRISRSGVNTPVASFTDRQRQPFSSFST